MLEIICPTGVIVLDERERDVLVLCIEIDSVAKALKDFIDPVLLKEATMVCLNEYEHELFTDAVNSQRVKRKTVYRKSQDPSIGADAIELNELHAKMCVSLKTGPRNTTKRYSMKEVIRRLRAGLSPEVPSDDIVYEDMTVQKKRKPRRSKIVCKRRKKGGKPK